MEMKGKRKMLRLYYNLKVFFLILKTKNDSKNVYILRHKFKSKSFFINTLFSTLETPTSSSQVIIVSGN